MRAACTLHRYGAYRESSAAVAQGDTVFQYQFNFKVVMLMMLIMLVGVPQGDTVFSYKFNFKVVTRVAFVCLLYFLAAFISC